MRTRLRKARKASFPECRDLNARSLVAGIEDEASVAGGEHPDADEIEARGREMLVEATDFRDFEEPGVEVLGGPAPEIVGGSNPG